MRCLHPRTVGFLADGKTISWSEKYFSKEYATFQLPCSKCIQCRLEYARQWAVRCVHEAKMHENNSFITLTYRPENLKSDQLQYKDFQDFAKSLREHILSTALKKINISQDEYRALPKDRKKEIYEPNQISIMVTGEYGDLKKRPHWHALIFNWRPTDLTHKYTNKAGDSVYSSDTLTKLWPHGISDLGSVTFESAGYVARYAAKKLIHKDEVDKYQPISKKSSKHAIGKSFLKQYWQDIFNHGQCLIESKNSIHSVAIPRYYEKWLQKEHPTEWARYVTKLKSERICKAQKLKDLEQAKQNLINDQRPIGKGHQITRSQTQKILIEEKFKKLQSYLKGDL